MKTRRNTCLLILSLLAIMSCAAPFKSANIDPATGLFPTSTEVDRKYVKIFRPLPGVQETNYVLLQTFSPRGDEKFYSFMKDALQKIGFKQVYSEREVSQMVIQGGLSQYVSNVSDLISLHNLARATGPFLVARSRVYRVSDVVFRFDLQFVEPLSGSTCLEMSRIRTNWLDMDTEINYPVLNLIKQWYDESTKLPYEKPKKGVRGKEGI